MSDYRLDHLHIFTDEPLKTATWFSETFGGELVHSLQSDGRPRVDVKFGSVFLYISRPPAGAHAAPTDGARRRGVDHIAFAVADVDGALARLSSQGVRVLSQPVTTRPGVRTAFVQGPEGIRIELMHRAPIDYGAISGRKGPNHC
jgi:catechol 2,3-dioxygenase-like lactoylglutathione lyase family enzyme